MVGRAERAGVISEWVFRHCAKEHSNLLETYSHSKTEPGRFHVAGECGAPGDYNLRLLGNQFAQAL
jgi:hypothetical protein